MNNDFRHLWAAMSRDNLLFYRLMSPKKPHPGQIIWLTNSVKPINTLVPGNRWGKSVVIAMKHIYKCIFKIGQTKADRRKNERYETISVAMSADQAEIVFNEAKILLKHPALAPLVKNFYSTPFPRIEFLNGAVMHCRSAHDGGKYIDGHKYMYLSIDEAGWIPNLRFLMNNVILLRLAGGGEIDLIGTPKGYNDLYFYFERGERKVKGYYSQKGSIYDNPFLPAEDIRMRDELLASADPKLRNQALFGDFIDFSGLAFTRDQRDNALDGSLRHHEAYIDGHRYVVGWDLGRTTDYTVGCVLDITTRPWKLVSYTRLNRVPWEEIYSTIKRVADEYHIMWSRIDATGPQGDVIEEELAKRGIATDPYKSSTKALKIDLINTLQNALDHGRISVGFRDEKDEQGNIFSMPIMEEPGSTKARNIALDGEDPVWQNGWGLLRLPLITQLMDEIGVYSIDDKDIQYTDSVMALALATHAAFEMSGLRPPIAGGIYGDIPVFAYKQPLLDTENTLAIHAHEVLGRVARQLDDTL